MVLILRLSRPMAFQKRMFETSQAVWDGDHSNIGKSALRESLHLYSSSGPLGRLRGNTFG